MAVLVGVGVLAGLLGRHGARAAEPAHVQHRARTSALVEEVVAASDELRQWQAAPDALAAVDAEGVALERAVRRSVRAVSAGHAAVRLATGAAVVAVAATVPAGAVSPATLALLLLLPVALGEVLAPLADAGALSVRTDAARARLDRLTALAPLVADPADPVPVPDAPAPVSLAGVSAGWGTRPCLRGLDLEVHPGERIAVRGPSGSGKSTLASLLVRHLDPGAGAVRLGAIDVRDATLDDVRRQVLLVGDDPHVFASSVCENVRLARPDADDEEVADALTRARLGAWVESLPHGMHTLVGSAGIAVSGGERARIGVARALLAAPHVLVLDEPTAHLDTATAREVADVLLEEGPDRAVVWITHGTVGLDHVDRGRDAGGERRGRERARGRERGQAAGGRARGSASVKVLPLPRTDWTSMRPPWVSTMRREIARPSPVPGMESASGLLERWNAEKRCTWSASEMPIPESRTWMRTQAGSHSTSTRTVPPRRVYLTALLTRLSTTSESSSGSPAHRHRLAARHRLDRARLRCRRGGPPGRSRRCTTSTRSMSTRTAARRSCTRE